ncbi:3-phosphoshikimate 1-carboxyvinyltransferase [Thermaerobacter sp. PB12/4term]|uniref:3-phosphoshikimate 1-carboxyvinyltransferase n=1 Tax=Thermaerobacter sp. PB12/4term TaxID=2293838 RepID=UPI000E32C77F|nr:3-phosphoshikimate 1-carboxyvinyltransferase [Thermaerobacter sp. PB12/4term]QIA26278.1 3-phosphoshikimate 1-carboxyvinyltransferase [Thermaerobacter sp. PB12/4term]
MHCPTPEPESNRRHRRAGGAPGDALPGAAPGPAGAPAPAAATKPAGIPGAAPEPAAGDPALDSGLVRVRPARDLGGTLPVPGDKSIAHRAALLAAAAGGRVVLDHYAPGRDAASTLACLAALGVTVRRPAPHQVVLEGPGIAGWQAPAAPLDAGNSGTTMRLLLGLLASRPFTATLTGDASLCRRPMDRVVEPLRRMGALISGREGGRRAPLTIRGGDLRAIHHDSPVASAQVKSAILLAGLFAAGRTSVREPALSRDHTERLLPLFGVAVERDGLLVAVDGGQVLAAPARLAIPGDPSAAAFYLAAALLCPGSRITLQGVGVNPTRAGFLEVLQAMGARVRVKAVRELQPGAGPAGDPAGPGRPARGAGDGGRPAPGRVPRGPAGSSATAGGPGEPVADLTAETSELRAVDVGGDLIPRLIDEIPILAVLATQARGTTRIRDAAELRVKETDRLTAIAEELRRLGARVDEHPGGLDIHGPTPLRGAVVSSRGDHRMAMALAVAGLVAAGETVITGAASAAVSDPGFFSNLRRLGAPVEGPEGLPGSPEPQPASPVTLGAGLVSLEAGGAGAAPGSLPAPAAGDEPA